ncbi:hypothetical protein ACU64V_11980 [Lysinibacillus capsici]
MAERFQLIQDEKVIGTITFDDKENDLKVLFKWKKDNKQEIETLKQFFDEQEELVKLLSKEKKIQHIIDGLSAMGFSYKNIESGDYEFNMQLSIGNKHLGVSSPLVEGLEESLGQSIMSDVMKRLKQNAEEKLKELAQKIHAKVEEGKHEEAAGLVLGNELSTNLYFVESLPTELTNTLYLIDRDSLSVSRQVRFTLKRIGLFGVNNSFNKAESDARWVLKHENNEHINSQIRFGMRLIIGNALAENELYESAQYQYELALKETKEVEVESIAWAYNNLGSCFLNQKKIDEAYHAYCQAGDMWLSIGNSERAVGAYMKLIKSQESQNPSEALEKLKEVINNIEKLASKETTVLTCDFVLGHLYFYKGKILNELKRLQEAEIAILKSYEYRKKLIGIEDELRATLSFLIILTHKLGKQDKESEWKKELDKISRNLTSEELLSQSLLHILSEDGDSEPGRLTKVEETVWKEGSTHQKLMFLITVATRSLHKNDEMVLECLDRALQLDIEKYADEYAIVLQLYSMFMKKNGKLEKAYSYLEKALHVKPSRLELYPDIIMLAQEMEDDELLLKHALEWIKLDETNGEVWYFIGLQFEKLGKPHDSYDAFNKALLLIPQEDEGHDYVKLAISRVIVQVMKNPQISTDKRPSVGDFLDEPLENTHLTINNRLLTKLLEFKNVIETHHRGDFWRRENGKVKWVSQPEKNAQRSLLLFLRSILHPDIEILDEVIIGEGRMDIYILIPPGIKVVIELKMCGEGYSSTYTKGAINQTMEYMKNKKCSLGYLIIFDARKRDVGQGFQKYYQYENKCIETVILDIRHQNPSKL